MCSFVILALLGKHVLLVFCIKNDINVTLLQSEKAYPQKILFTDRGVHPMVGWNLSYVSAWACQPKCLPV